MKWLVRLYPKSWRARYGEEFVEVLAGQRASLGMIVDVLGGALDAHLHPQVHVRQTGTQGDETMTADMMMKRVAAGGPAPTPREQLAAGIAMAVAALILAAIYIGLSRTSHANPMVEALGYTIAPAMGLFYVQMAYLRRHSATTQFVTIAAGLALLYLMMWGACVVAFHLHHA